MATSGADATSRRSIHRSLGGGAASNLNRALFILAIIAIALLVRSECTPNDKTCSPGDPQPPENQEEEATSANVPSASTVGAPVPTKNHDPEDLPEFKQEIVVLGH